MGILGSRTRSPMWRRGWRADGPGIWSDNAYWRTQAPNFEPTSLSWPQFFALCQDPDDSVEAFVRHPEQAGVGVAQFEDQEHRASDADRSERG